jgi:sigma-B regulation protein RsbU (phosphoserine phosphatase)
MIDGNQKIVQLENEIERLKSAVEELTVLNDLAIAASSSMEVDQVLDTIVEKSIKALKAEQGSILLVTEQQEKPLQTLIRQADRISRTMTYKVGDHITGWVLKHQAPLVIENLATDHRFNTTEEEKKAIRNLLAVPTQFKGKLLGLLMVTNKKTSEPFSKDDIRLLSIIAAQSGQLIRNSQLQQETLEKERLAQELETARKIQMGLIPPTTPVLQAFDFASHISPAEEVGGDYFDFLTLQDSLLGIVQADVSGHGAAAAMIMAMLKGILHSITHNFSSADKALQEINQILHHTSPPDMFITMTMMVLDPQTKTMQFSNAGHNPPIFYESQSHTVSLLENPGCALNCDVHPVYQVKDIKFNENDLIFVYTDGIPEAFNRNSEMFGYERLKESVQKAAERPAPQIIELVKMEFLKFLDGSPQTDDIAMIAIKAV